jgi:hypothetical protein
MISELKKVKSLTTPQVEQPAQTVLATLFLPGFHSKKFIRPGDA